MPERFLLRVCLRLGVPQIDRQATHLSSISLRVVQVEDTAAILGSYVVALTVELSRIVHRKEDLQEFFVSDGCRVVEYLHRLGSTRRSGADRFVGWIFNRSSNVATECADTSQSVKARLNNSPGAWSGMG
jgi:hypothetical protein